MTEKEHLHAVWKMTKRKPSGLQFAEMPKEYEYLWRYFVGLSNSGEISPQSIESYCRLMHLKLTPSEVSMIFDWDLLYKKVINEQAVTPPQPPKSPHIKR